MEFVFVDDFLDALTKNMDCLFAELMMDVIEQDLKVINSRKWGYKMHSYIHCITAVLHVFLKVNE